MRRAFSPEPYLLTATDLVLPGIAEDFALKREYRSARHKCGLFGKGWQTRWESRLSHDGRQMHLTAATGHTMCFSLEGDAWVNQTPGCGRFSQEADVSAGIWRLYDGAERRKEPDGEGRVTRQYHPETGEETRSDYDPDENRIREVRPDGSTVRYFYDACGRVAKEVQPEDYVPELDGGPGTCYTFDSLGRVTQETDTKENRSAPLSMTQREIRCRKRMQRGTPPCGNTTWREI